MDTNPVVNLPKNQSIPLTEKQLNKTSLTMFTTVLIAVVFFAARATDSAS